MDELTEQLESQRQAADKDREALQLQHAQLRQELQDQIEELNAENTTLGKTENLCVKTGSRLALTVAC